MNTMLVCANCKRCEKHAMIHQPTHCYHRNKGCDGEIAQNHLITQVGCIIIQHQKWDCCDGDCLVQCSPVITRRSGANFIQCQYFVRVFMS